jgi:hypothetical protein
VTLLSCAVPVCVDVYDLKRQANGSIACVRVVPTPNPDYDQPSTPPGFAVALAYDYDYLFQFDTNTVLAGGSATAEARARGGPWQAAAGGIAGRRRRCRAPNLARRRTSSPPHARAAGRRCFAQRSRPPPPRAPVQISRGIETASSVGQLGVRASTDAAARLALSAGSTRGFKAESTGSVALPLLAAVDTVGPLAATLTAGVETDRARSAGAFIPGATFVEPDVSGLGAAGAVLNLGALPGYFGGLLGGGLFGRRRR